MRLLTFHVSLDCGILKLWIDTIQSSKLSKCLGHFFYLRGEGIGRPRFVHIQEGLSKFAYGRVILII